MRERMRFVLDAEEELFSMTELCERYGISRVTGYKWLKRFREGGISGLGDRSRAPAHCPHRTAARVVELLVAARQQHPFWGARKLVRWLARRHPDLSLPAPSTATDILKGLGLVKPRRRRRHLSCPSHPLTEASGANVVWTADFKGQFKTLDGHYCYPLTVADSYSRYLLGCRSQLSVETLPTRKNFQRLLPQERPALPSQSLPAPARTNGCTMRVWAATLVAACPASHIFCESPNGPKLSGARLRLDVESSR